MKYLSAGQLHHVCGLTCRISFTLFPDCFQLSLSCLSLLSPWSFTTSLGVIIAPFTLTHTHTDGQTCTPAAASKQQHISWLPLSFVSLLGARVARHWISFILSLIVFCPRIIAKRFVWSRGKTQWTCERHLVSFVSLDLFAVSVIDLFLYKGEQMNKECSSFFNLHCRSFWLFFMWLCFVHVSQCKYL